MVFKLRNLAILIAQRVFTKAKLFAPESRRVRKTTEYLFIDNKQETVN
jgi:hypothetical protein